MYFYNFYFLKIIKYNFRRKYLLISMKSPSKDKAGQWLILVLLLLAVVGVAVWACVPKSKIDKFSMPKHQQVPSVNDAHEIIQDIDNTIDVLDTDPIETEDFDLIGQNCGSNVPSSWAYFNSPDVPERIGMGESGYLGSGGIIGTFTA